MTHPTPCRNGCRIYVREDSDAGNPGKPQTEASYHDQKCDVAFRLPAQSHFPAFFRRRFCHTVRCPGNSKAQCARRPIPGSAGSPYTPGRAEAPPNRDLPSAVQTWSTEVGKKPAEAQFAQEMDLQRQ